jgi:hypothetical protein
MFIITSELQEVLDTFKLTFKVLKNPRALLQVSAMLLLLVLGYFSVLLLG